MADNQLLRKIPKVDDILKSREWKKITGLYPEAVAKDMLRKTLEELRVSIKGGSISSIPEVGIIVDNTEKNILGLISPGL